MIKTRAEEWLSVREAAERLRVGEKALYRIIAENRLGSKAVIRVGRSIRLNFSIIKSAATEGIKKEA